MVVIDDERRYVDANPAACLLFRLKREQLLALRVDDVIPPELHPSIESGWDHLRRLGEMTGRYELLMPDGPRLVVDYNATANFRPGRHLSIMMPSSSGGAQDAGVGSAAGPKPYLSEREREVLVHVAVGYTGEAIANRLHIATATVETHVRSCLAKLGARNRAHAIALAIDRDEITLDDMERAGPD